MKTDLNGVKIDWSIELNDVANEKDDKKRAAMPIHSIVAKFKLLGDNNLLGKLQPDMISKFKLISDEKIKYYQETRFGFIKKFFSSLRNLLTVGKFISSGQLGHDLAEKCLNPQKTNEAAAPAPKQTEPRADSKPKPEKPLSLNDLYNQEPEAESNEEGEVDIFFLAPDQTPEEVLNANLEPEWPEEGEGVEVEREEESDDDADYLSFDEDIVSEELPAAPPEVSPEVSAPPPPKLNPRQVMEEDLLSCWKDEDKGLHAQILVAWKGMFAGAEIIGWESVAKNDHYYEYKLTLEKTVEGTVPTKDKIFTLQKEVVVRFSERKDKSGKLQKVISFVQGAPKVQAQLGRFIPWVTTYINEIVVESTPPFPCHVVTKLKTIDFDSLQENIEDWQTVTWTEK